MIFHAFQLFLDREKKLNYSTRALTASLDNSPSNKLPSSPEKSVAKICNLMNLLQLALEKDFSSASRNKKCSN